MENELSMCTVCAMYFDYNATGIDFEELISNFKTSAASFPVLSNPDLHLIIDLCNAFFFKGG